MKSIEILPGTMMMRDGILLPESAQIESCRYSNVWRSLTGIDSFAFDQKLSAAGLHLFFLAGKLEVLEPGRGASAVRRGIRRILARGQKLDVNCMQVTEIKPSQILGFPCTAIRADSFHIQAGRTLQSRAQRRSEQNDRDWACD
jgi:hypothetical protein